MEMFYYIQYTLVIFMNQWTSQLPDIAITNPILKAWITDPASTTKKFKTAGIHASYHIQRDPITSDIVWTDFLSDQPISRTVEIKVMKHTFMYASSFISAKQEIKNKIQTLNAQPLGTILFSEKDLIRSNFLYAMGPGQAIQRISKFKSPNLKCILVEAFNINHPLFCETPHG